MPTQLERIQQVIAGTVPLPPIGQLMGFGPVAAEAGRVTIRLVVDERLANPMGTLHGGRARGNSGAHGGIPAAG